MSLSTFSKSWVSLILAPIFWTSWIFLGLLLLLVAALPFSRAPAGKTSIFSYILCITVLQIFCSLFWGIFTLFFCIRLMKTHADCAISIAVSKLLIFVFSQNFYFRFRERKSSFFCANPSCTKFCQKVSVCHNYEPSLIVPDFYYFCVRQFMSWCCWEKKRE